eukprot:949638-Amphidinium_carterae.1
MILAVCVSRSCCCGSCCCDAVAVVHLTKFMFEYLLHMSGMQLKFLAYQPKGKVHVIVYSPTNNYYSNLFFLSDTIALQMSADAFNAVPRRAGMHVLTK